MRKKVLLRVILVVCCLAGTAEYAFAAAAWTAPAVPFRVEVVRGEGFMIYGSFGNSPGCTIPDRVFVQSDSPAYKEILAAVYLALSQGKAITLWVHSCEPRTWYAVSSTTFSTVSVNATISIDQ